MRRLTFAVLLVLAGPAGAIHAGTAFEDPIYGFSKTSDIVYGTGPVNGGVDNLDLLLDVYQPTDIGGGALPPISPGLVMIHGGGFTGGDKGDLGFIAEVYASYGYVVTSINYRMFFDNVPETHGPADFLTPPPPPFGSLPAPQGAYTINAAIEDASKAMAWIRANAATYNVDSGAIAIGGGSAGAITALLQAYNSPPPEIAPQAVLSFLGAMYGTEDTIQAGDPPAFNVASSNDTTVPFDPPLGAQAVADRMNQLGVYNEFYVQDIGHAVDFFAEFNGQTLLDHNMNFLRQTLVVPEPSSFALAALAAIALLAFARRRKSGRVS